MRTRSRWCSSRLYETHWKGILRPTWERELDLQAFRPTILAYWKSSPDHRQPNTRQYQQKCSLTRDRLVTADVYRARSSTVPLPIGASVWYHSFDGSWWSGKIKQAFDAPGRVKSNKLFG